MSRDVSILSYNVFTFVSFSYVPYNAVDGVITIAGMAFGALFLLERIYFCLLERMTLGCSRWAAVSAWPESV